MIETREFTIPAQDLNYHQLVGEFKRGLQPRGESLQFSGIDGLDIYNPALIYQKGTRYLAGRVESRESDWLNVRTYNPAAKFFVEDNGVWKPAKGMPVFSQFEDPFATWIVDESGKRKVVFGGVRINRSKDKLPMGVYGTGVDLAGNAAQITTEFFIADRLENLEPDKPFVQIGGMKDIRMVQRNDGRLVVLTRPVGGEAGKGSIGALVIDDLNELSEDVVFGASLLPIPVDKSMRLGTNELHLDEKAGQILVLGHAAQDIVVEMGGFNTVKRDYAAMTFRLDANNPWKTSQALLKPRIIATRDNFPEAEVKRVDLVNVLFGTALDLRANGMAYLYGGLSDAAVGRVPIAKRNL